MKLGLSGCGLVASSLGTACACVQSALVATTAPGHLEAAPDPTSSRYFCSAERGLWVSCSRGGRGGRRREQSQGSTAVLCMPRRAQQLPPWAGSVPMLESHPNSGPLTHTDISSCLPHLSPSPSGSKIKAARDITTVLRKTQPLGVEITDPESYWAGSHPAMAPLLSSQGIHISILPELWQRPGPFFL